MLLRSPVEFYYIVPSDACLIYCMTVCVCVYLGCSVRQALEQLGNNVDSSSSHLCFLLRLYQGSQAGAQLEHTHSYYYDYYSSYDYY